MTVEELQCAPGISVVGIDKFRNEAPMVAIHVEDNGQGMSPELLAKIFAPYFSTKAPGKGTGLGLVIVQRLVANAKGLLRVASTPGQGTRITVYLPVMLG